jgi:ceramide glucosyltransferase
LPLALLVCAASPAWWPALPVTFFVRALAAYTVSTRVLRTRWNWLLLPIEDVLEFCFWVAGFFGNTISWRGRRYRLSSDGRFELIPPSEK